MYFKHRYANIYYEQVGDTKQVIIILPGWGDTRGTFQFIIDHFKQDFSIYIFDYPGFGNSPPIHKELTMNDYATIFYDFMQEKKIDSPIILSHSFGGRITAILLGRYSIKVKKVILMDVAGIKRKKIRNKLRTLLYKTLKKICTIINQPLLLNKIRSSFSSTDYMNVHPYMYQTFKNIIQEDLRKDYAHIESDVLIIWGKKDPDTPVQDAHYLHRVIHNSGLIIFPQASHFSYLDEPYLTLRILHYFLKQKDMD